MERRDTPRYEIQVPLTFSGHAIDGRGMVTSLSKEGCHVTSANQAEVFKKLDTNSDGNVSQEEFAMIANLKMGKDREGKDREGKNSDGNKDGSGTTGSGSGSDQRPK